MTSDGDALFRAICELPAEDTPRLMFADWLQENGHPERAEFIRLQCEAWGLCPAYPTLATARTRAPALERAFGTQWFNELPDVQGLEWGDVFVRGFIDTARTFFMPDATAALEAAFAASPIRFLYVTELRRGQLRELLEFPHLGRLSKLHLPGIVGDEARLLTAAAKRFPHMKID